MVFGMGPLELMLILGIALLIFGPKNLPKLGKMFGKGAAKVREGAEAGKQKIDAKFEEVEQEKKARAAAAADEDYDEEYEDDEEDDEA